MNREGCKQKTINVRTWDILNPNRRAKQTQQTFEFSIRIRKFIWKCTKLKPKVLNDLNSMIFFVAHDHFASLGDRQAFG